MKIYKAFSEHSDCVLRVFRHPKKPEGVYFAHTFEFARRWADNLFITSKIIIKEYDIPNNIEVFGARDGYPLYGGPHQNYYFTGSSSEVIDKLNVPLKFAYKNRDGSWDIEVNDKALPELIVPKKYMHLIKDLNKVHVIKNY